MSLAKLDLNINSNDKPEEKFISYARFKQDQNKSNEGFVIVENIAELEEEEKKTLNMIVHEIFTKNNSELKKNKRKNDKDLEKLFFKDTAAIKFLLDAQSMLVSTDFLISLHPTKFEYIAKILKIIITSKIIRHDKN